MDILAIDSTTGPCSVALWQQGRVVAYAEEKESHRQAAMLVPLIEQCMREARCSYDRLDAIAVTNGPGSFTGIRIGLATARAISLAAEKPLYSFSALEVLAWQALPQEKPILAAMSAGKGQLFIQIFAAGKKLQPAENAGAIDITSLDKVISPGDYAVCGNASMELQILAKEKGYNLAMLDNAITPDAKALAALAAIRIENETASRNTEALYLRAPDAKLPTKAF